MISLQNPGSDLADTENNDEDGIHTSILEDSFLVPLNALETFVNDA